jgi:hypothetical protein
MKCSDTYFDCPLYQDYCNTEATLGDVPVNIVCKRTCKYYCDGILKKLIICLIFL